MSKCNQLISHYTHKLPHNLTIPNPLPSKTMFLPLQSLLQPQQLPPLNAQILRRNNIHPIRLPPIALRLKTLEHHRQLLAKLFPPHTLILLLPNLHKSHPLTRDFAPGLVVIAVRPLLGVDESVFRRGGDLGFGEDGGGEDADVGVDVAGVVDVGVCADGLEGDVGAVAAGLGMLLLGRRAFTFRIGCIDLQSRWASSSETTRNCS